MKHFVWFICGEFLFFYIEFQPNNILKVNKLKIIQVSDSLIKKLCIANFSEVNYCCFYAFTSLFNKVATIDFTGSIKYI